jgi:hypothetical protein
MLFSLTAEYTPQALNAMRENPTTDRRAASPSARQGYADSLHLKEKWLAPAARRPGQVRSGQQSASIRHHLALGSTDVF